MNVNKLMKSRLLCQHQTIILNSARTGWFDHKPRKFFRDISDKEEPTFASENEPNPLSDVEKRIEESKARMQWRKPTSHKTTFLTEGLRFLAPERTQLFFEIIQQPLDTKNWKRSLELKRMEWIADQQRFITDRHRILGNDLAAAHFLVARGGQVRFTKSKEWFKKDKYDEYDLPRVYDPEYIIDAIKADNMELYYEGLENIRRLNCMRYFSVRNVKAFDDWCMDRFCGHQFERLEILDVSGTSVTANGLYAVPKLPALKAIVLDTTDRSIEFQLALNLLEEVMPRLRILSSVDVHDDVWEAEKKKKTIDSKSSDPET